MQKKYLFQTLMMSSVVNETRGLLIPQIYSFVSLSYLIAKSCRKIKLARANIIAMPLNLGEKSNVLILMVLFTIVF